jgi:signal transduction histidine kinase
VAVNRDDRAVRTEGTVESTATVHIEPQTGVQDLRWASRSPGTRTPLVGVDQRRRLERDLHDGVQSELVALVVRLALAAREPDTPPAVVDMLGGLQLRAQAVLDSVRDIARGIYPQHLAGLGLREALRADAARAPIELKVLGTAPRSTHEAEEAVYFSCSEAIQNASKHVGRSARVELRLRHSKGTLLLQIADDGRGFDPSRASTGAGLRNIRDRIHDRSGTFRVASKPGCGTVLTISLPWPTPAEPAR